MQAGSGLPAHGSFAVRSGGTQVPLYWTAESFSWKCDTICGSTSNASTTTTAGLAEVTRIVSVCWPGLKSCSVTIGVCISCGRAKRSTCLTGPPSTLTSAVPPSPLRAPIQVTHLPLNVNCTVAPAVVVRTAEPPLHPNLESAGPQSPGLNVTLGSVCSKRPGLLTPPAFVVPGLPPLGLSLPPPPPQEASRPANKTPIYAALRFMSHSFPGKSPARSVGLEGVALPQGSMVRTTLT